MQHIRCIIIDDEPLARKGLKEYINDVDFLQLDSEFDNPIKAMKVLSEGNIQLIFLDIQMPKVPGPQYALDGFELNALDYLVKPISFERFLKAAMRAKEYYEVRIKNTSEEPSRGKEDFFFIKADNKLVKIFYDEILFVEALQNYVCIHTKSKKYITYLTFKSIEEYLPSDRFIKTHKSFIISASKIDNIDGNDIRIGEFHIPISRTSKDDVMERLLKGRFLKR